MCNESKEWKSKFIEAFSVNVDRVPTKEVIRYLEDIEDGVAESVIRDRNEDYYWAIKDSLGIFQAGIEYGRSMK